MRSGDVQGDIRPTPLGLLALALLAPTAGAHGLLSLGLVVPEGCPGGGWCLRTVDNQPDLHAGDTADVNVYNDDTDEHRIRVAVEGGTDDGTVLADSGLLDANSSRALGDVEIPPDAQGLSAWCAVDDHEGQGEHLRIELAAPHEVEDSTPGPGTGVALAGLLLALAMARRARRP